MSGWEVRMSNSTKNEEVLKGIEELHNQDIEASKARDFDTLLSLWTDDGVLILPGAEPIIGREALKSYMNEHAQDSSTYKIRKYEHRWEEIKVLGDWAFEWGYFEGEMEMLDSGEVVGQKGKLFRILKRQEDGSWKAARAIGVYDTP